MGPKRKNPNKDGNSESPYSKRPRRYVNQSDVAQTIFDLLKESEDKDGHIMAESFIKLPSKRYHADYYEKIIDPLDLTKIGQRIKQDEYRDIEILTADIQLMTSNAKTFYEEHTHEYQDACSVWETYLNIKARVLDDGKLTEPSKPKLSKKDSDMSTDDLRELYEKLVTEVDDDGRVIAEMFMELPDTSNEQYYDVIKEPIDFLTIGNKLEEGQYPSIAEFKKDVFQLVKNAKTFNEPHSQIYQDAVALKIMLREKIDELERARKGDGRSSGRVRHRKSWGVSRVSGRLHEKSLKKQESVEMQSDVHEASIIDPNEDGHQALLYNEIVNYKNNLGHTISDPFVRLPNKRFYPMYYDDIENPISLKIIRKKVQSKKYENCDEMAEDFSLLFSNARQFNISTSQIHKDASTLQKFMDSKLAEYSAKEEEDMEEVSGSEDEDESDPPAAPEKEEDGAERKVTENEESTEKLAEENEETKKKKRKKRRSNKESLQGRLHLLFDVLMEAKNESGREMITLFLEKPSRKDYPDYYKLVLEPIDMKMIEKKIRQDKYFSIDDMLEDFDLMFNNARHYNEPGSEVYSDADALEKLLLEKNRELGPLPVFEGSPEKAARSSKKSKGSETEEKMEKLFSTVRDYVDPTQRMICEIFMHLPTKQLLPDYYKVIKRPLDMDRIHTRMQTGQYFKLEEMLADMLLMFENACNYNEPGSVIYKDALLLQKHAVDKFYEIEPVDPILSPEDLVQEMLISLFMSVMNHQDDSGRCYSESLSSATDGGSKKEEAANSTTTEENDSAHKKHDGGSNEKLTLEIMKKNLHNRRYRRLDVFQDHMFEIFEAARNNNRTDSEVYEDVVELQKFFIKIRDELSKNGETLMSPALSLTLKRLENEIEAEKKEKLSLESKEDDQANSEAKEISGHDGISSQSNEMNFKGTMYAPGDFVYIENPDNPSAPHIVNIAKLYTDESGQRMLYGVWLYRPEATFHMASKKFFLKEVFKSDYYNAVPVSLIQGKCFVMLSKDYFKLRPVGFKEEDVFVAESRYSSRVKSFKRLKLTQWPHSSVELVAREAPLPVIRISSCYSVMKTEESNPLEKMRTMLMQDIEDSWATDVIDVERKNIEMEGQASGETKHYIQYRVGNMWIKLGDCVYIQQADSTKQKIARVERLWTDATGKVWFHGVMFIRPEDVQHDPTRMFCKNELLLSCFESTFSFDSVAGKCIVLYAKDYFACRPTEMPEDNIYMFESKYSSEENLIKKIKGKRYTPTHKVVDDEYYYYKRSLTVQSIVSPFLLKAVEEEMKTREEEAENAKSKPPVEETPPAPTEPARYPTPTPPQPHMYPSPGPVQPYPQPHAMMSGQPYQHYPQIVQQYSGSPAQGTPPNYPPHPYAQQQQAYPPGVRYPPGIPGQQYQTSPHMYPASPHGAQTPSMTPTSGVQPAEGSRPPSTRPEAAPTPPTKRKGRVGQSTGYILFASYYHPKVRAEHPDMPFGEISKIVGEEWRHLEDEKKREYEEKAKEHTARLEAEGRLIPKKKKKKKEAEETPPPPPQLPPQHPGAMTPQQFGPQHPHRFAPTPGHQTMTPRMPMSHPGAPPQQYPMASYAQTPTGHPCPQQVAATPPPPPPTVAQKHRMKRGPLFLQPPPKAQRVMHSEAYLRYIEGLERGSQSVSNWEKTVTVKQKNVHLTKEEEQKLPAHWLGNGKGRFENITSALWSLRDLMLKDALAIKKTCN